MFGRFKEEENAAAQKVGAFKQRAKEILLSGSFEGGEGDGSFGAFASSTSLRETLSASPSPSASASSSESDCERASDVGLCGPGSRSRTAPACSFDGSMASDGGGGSGGRSAFFFPVWELCLAGGEDCFSVGEGCLPLGYLLPVGAGCLPVWKWEFSLPVGVVGDFGAV